LTIFDQYTTSALHTNNKEKSPFEVGNFKLLKNGQKMKKIENFQKILKMCKKCYKSRVKSLKSDKKLVILRQNAQLQKIYCLRFGLTVISVMFKKNDLVGIGA